MRPLLYALALFGGYVIAFNLAGLYWEHNVEENRWYLRRNP